MRALLMVFAAALPAEGLEPFAILATPVQPVQLVCKRDALWILFCPQLRAPGVAGRRPNGSASELRCAG